MKARSIMVFISFAAIITACAVAMPWVTAPATPEKVDALVYRGPHPYDMDLLASMGITEIISLEDPDATIIERKAANSLGIRFVNFPMSEYDPPTVDDLRKVAGLIYDGRIISGGAVYVHCRRGIDRTGYAIAAYRIVYQGWDVDEAYSEVLAHGHSSLWYWRWKKSLEELWK